MKARLNALSAVTGLAQWRVIVEAIDCFFHDLPATDRELVDGLSERLHAGGLDCSRHGLRTENQWQQLSVVGRLT